jgi:hypothetical protein
MALIIPPGFAQVQLPFQHELLSRTALITYGLDVSDAAGDFITVADEQPTIFLDEWKQELDSQVVVGPATLRVGQDGGDPLSVEGSDSGSGEETSGMLPPNCALLVKKQSATGGRKGRGRLYIPWIIQENAVDDAGVIDGASVTARQLDASGWLTNLAGGGSGTYTTPMVILHDSSGAGAEPAPSVVTALTVDNRIATQRRRMNR